MTEPIDGSSRLCHRCVGEKVLKAKIKNMGRMAYCSFCRKHLKTICLEEVADIFDKVLEENFVRTENEPTGMEYMMSRESDYQWERSGVDIVELLQEVGQIELEVAEAIRQLLEDKHFDFDETAMGDEGDFDPGSRYTERNVDSKEFHSEWRSFEESLKTKSRYFSKRAPLTLTILFNGIHRSTTVGNRPVILTAGPGTSITSLFRARVFQDEQKLIRALERPDLEIGPPPPAAAVAGRMNARGISTFYGATDREVALSEVRPFVGSRVLTAKFDLLRPVSLLDLAALSEVSARGSLFDSNHRYQMAKANFLRSLSEKMTAPVMPDAEIFEYLPTQVVAEYLASQVNPELDGILYPSAQTKNGKNNVVLFHESSLVETLTISDDTATFVETEIQTADGPEPEYWVFQRTAPREDGTAPADPFAAEMSQKGGPGDGRIPTLRIDLSSVEVHHIESVVYLHADYQVHRSRD
jgi:RES domain/HEPN/RES N-terminal domain 1